MQDNNNILDETYQTRAETLVDVLDWRVQRHPDKLLYTWLGEKNHEPFEERSLTFSQFYAAVVEVAIYLQSEGTSTSWDSNNMLFLCVFVHPIS